MDYDGIISDAKRLIKDGDYDKAGEMLAGMLNYYHAEGHVLESDDGPGVRAEKLWRSIVGKCSKDAKTHWDPGFGG